MTPASAKSKGRRLQDYIAARFHTFWPALEPGDVKPAIMGESGIDIKLSPAARRLIPFDVEAKNVEKLSVWDAFKQAQTNAGTGRIPLLVFKRNRSEVMCVLKFEDLLQLTANTDGTNLRPGSAKAVLSAAPRKPASTTAGVRRRTKA